MLVRTLQQLRLAPVVAVAEDADEVAEAARVIRESARAALDELVGNQKMPRNAVVIGASGGGRAVVPCEDGLPSLLHCFPGVAFGGCVVLSGDLGERLARASGFLRGELGWIGLALALVGLARLVIPGGVPGRWRLLALTGLAFLALLAFNLGYTCLLYTSDAADDLLWVDLGGRRSIKKKNRNIQKVKRSQ